MSVEDEQERFDWLEFWYQNPTKIDSLVSQLNGRRRRVRPSPLCTSMVRRGWILASPIAIWFPNVDPDTELIDWWTGRRTPRLDESGVPFSG